MIFFDKTLFHVPSGFHCLLYPQHHSSTQHDLRFPNAYIIALITISLKQLVSDQCPDISRIQDFLKKHKAVSVGFTREHFHATAANCLLMRRPSGLRGTWETRRVCRRPRARAVRGLDSGRSGVITRRQNLNQLWSNMSELESIMINYDHIVSVLHCVACVLFGCPLLGVHMLKPRFSHKIIWGSPVGLLKICLSILTVSIWIQSCFGDPVRVQGSRAQSVAWERDRARGADHWPITLMAQLATGVMLVHKPPI